jgi:small nuclear ribonucleoprotein (snRNP)-like protein
MESDAETLSQFVNKPVVLDTRASFIYIGILSAVDEWFYTLTEVDVHDHSESTSTKEMYIIDTRRFGIRENRKKVLVRKNEVISISLLSDVIEY